MRDPQLAIRKAYVTALQNRLTLHGKSVPVTDRVRDNQPPPYVLLSTQTGNDSLSAKRCNLFDTTFLFDVVTGFSGSAGGNKDSDLIADQILQVVLPDTDAQGRRQLPAMEAPFRLVHSSLEFTGTLEEKNQTTFFFRRIIRLRNIIEQLN